MRVLIVEDDEVLRLSIRSALRRHGHTTEEACDGVEGVKMVQDSGPFDAVLLDVNMPRMSGLEALGKIKEILPQTFCVVLTAFSDIKDAVQAIKLGAYDYLEKPVDASRLLGMLRAAEEAKALVKKIAFSAPQVYFAEGREMIGGSSEIQKVFDVVHKLSKVETSVLIRGESGTGKELVARAIHFNSHRKKGPFVAFNCAAIPENLIESELFGHEKGAFTGADRRKIGKFQYADGGTIFLDEIGDITHQMQVKLLRVLQEKAFNTVGSPQEVRADVRIIAATNRPLEKMIETGTFRSDLFYRLNILPVNLPPLRERREDVYPLTCFMIEKFNKIHNRTIKSVEPAALDALRIYQWPGNIRELENVIEHAFILQSGDVIQLSSLPSHIHHLPGEAKSVENPLSGESLNLSGDYDGLETSVLNYPALKERFEREFIIRALKTFNGRINRTAEHTMMTKMTLLRKLERYGIDPKDFQNH